MKSTFQILLFSIISVVIYATFMRSCNDVKVNSKTIYLDGKPYEVLKQVVDTQYLPKIIKAKKDTILKDTTIYIPVPLIVDTMAILKNYFSKNVYTDTLHLSDAGYVFVRDTVSKNTINGRFYHAVINQKVITETTIVKEPNKNKYYFGFTTSFNKQQLGFIQANILFQNKKDIIYGVGLSNDLNKNNFINASIHWRIK